MTKPISGNDIFAIAAAYQRLGRIAQSLAGNTIARPAAIHLPAAYEILVGYGVDRHVAELALNMWQQDSIEFDVWCSEVCGYRGHVSSLRA